MRTGKFRTTGLIDKASKLSGYAFIGDGIAFLILAFTAIFQTSLFFTYPLSSVPTAGWIVIVVVMISIVIWFNIDLKSRNHVMQLEVVYMDNREAGGKLQITFLDPNGNTRTIFVRKLEPKPKEALFTIPHVGSTGGIPVKGLVSSLKIIAEGRSPNLLLGFATSEEMEGVYSELSPIKKR